MVTLESNIATEAELKEALSSFGIETPEPEPATNEPAKEATETPGEPGGKPAAEPEVKPAAEAVPAETTTQEVPPGEPGENAKKAKGGLQRKVEKLTAALEDERGDKAQLKADLDAAKAKLAEIEKTTKPAESAKPAEPVRPKRPTKASVEFDEDKYEEAMSKYDEDLDTYFKAVTDKAKAEAVATTEAKLAQTQAEQKASAVMDAFVTRKDAGKAAYLDWDETLDAMPKDAKTVADTSDHVRAYILSKSKQPADLIMYFAKDYLEDDGTESERIGAMDAYDQILELRAIEMSIAEKRKAPIVTSKKETPPPAAAQAEPPAKPKPPAQRTPDAPIEPVSNRGASADPGNLNQQVQAAAERGDGREVRRLRDLQKVQAARAAGRVP